MIVYRFYTNFLIVVPNLDQFVHTSARKKVSTHGANTPDRPGMPLEGSDTAALFHVPKLDIVVGGTASDDGIPKLNTHGIFLGGRGRYEK